MDEYAELVMHNENKKGGNYFLNNNCAQEKDDILLVSYDLINTFNIEEIKPGTGYS